MLRIRVKDDAQFEFLEGASEFGKSHRRDSKVVGFTLKNMMQPSFFETILETKMIPKTVIEEFEGIIFKVLQLDNGMGFIVQDPCNTIRVLKYEEGYCDLTPLEDITEDDDVLVYDSTNKDWALSGVKEIRHIQRDLMGDQIEDALAVFASAELSKYMVKSSDGLILNGVLII